jgi:hypothetical protein
MTTIRNSKGFYPIRLLNRNKKAVVMSIFLLISSAIWFVNKLSYDYQSNVDVELHIVSSNAQELVSCGQQQNLRCLARAKGYDFLWHKIFANPIVRIDISHYNFSTATLGMYGLHTQHVQPLVANMLGEEFEIIDLHTDTINFCIDALSSKKVPIRPNITISCALQHIQCGSIEFAPDSVIINGAQRDIEGVDYVETIPVVLNNVNCNVSTSIPLALPEFNRYVLANKEIMLRLNVIRYTENRQTLQIVCKNKPTNVNIDFFPSNVDVSFYYAIEYSRIFVDIRPQLVVDYADISNSMSGQVALHIDSLPDYVLLTRMTHPNVRFILTQL